MFSIITTTGGPPQTTPFSAHPHPVLQLATVVTDGFDIESSYRFAFERLASDLDGEHDLRMLATHVSKFITDSGVPGTIPVESAGSNGGSIPHWKLLGVQTYQADRWSLTLTENWISNGVINRNYIQCTTGCPLPTAVHPPSTTTTSPAPFYLSVGGSYEWTDNISTISRWTTSPILDRPHAGQTTPNQVWRNASLYDTIGRIVPHRVRFKSD